MPVTEEILASLTWAPNLPPPSLPRQERLRRIRHSASHIMAQAVREMFPDAKLAIGPPIENGFYYDMELSRNLTDADLPEIEKRMRKIVARDPQFLHSTLARPKAMELFREWKQDYKLELLAGIADPEVSLYKQDRFLDLCAGPHVAQGGICGHFKLLSLAGAYWRGDEHRPMLQRIYGTAWETEAELEEYLQFLEDSKARDHRKLGAQLDLFSFHPWSGGCAFWHPHGVTVREELRRLWRETHKKAGYVEIMNPVIYRKELFETSGHWEHFRDDMFLIQETNAEGKTEATMALKPMNCPDTHLYYKTRQHSYRDLPLRISEGQLLHRNEPMGTLHGLMRARVFSQDDAHIFLHEDQVQEEIERIMELLLRIYAFFGLRYSLTLSTKPEKAMGAPELWEKAEAGLRQALAATGQEYTVDAGGGAFYGPKIDVMVHDSMGRKWQCGTVQLDFNLPRRFELEFIDRDNQPRTPVVIHRVLFGSVERFLGILIEHFAGALPTWLAPVQVVVLPIAEGQDEFARSVAARCEERGLRAEMAPATTKISYRIREAEMHKVPYMLVVGKREAESGAVSLRTYQEKDRGVVALDAVIDEIAAKNRDRTLDVAVKDYSQLFRTDTPTVTDTAY
ncbi:MAG TPA: threonine--tRNA ligase [Terriglobales bacterium]|nr:threonine--tRNA ligase [Terriglobales bacterium]